MHEIYPETIDLRRYIERAAGRTRIYGLVRRNIAGMRAEALARALYKQDPDGVALYESNATVAIPSMRDRIWRLGRPEALAVRQRA